MKVVKFKAERILKNDLRESISRLQAAKPSTWFILYNDPEDEKIVMSCGAENKTSFSEQLGMLEYAKHILVANKEFEDG